MTALEFVAWVQEYYAPYRRGQQEEIWNYLKDLAPSYLDALKAVLVKNFSGSYRDSKAPDVAIFERCSEEAGALHAERVDPTRARIEAPPEDESSAELMALDWTKVFRDAIRSRKNAQENTIF